MRLFTFLFVFLGRFSAGAGAANLWTASEDLIRAGRLDILLPDAGEFEIVTDKTERGGDSELALKDVQDGINFQGQVGAIPGSSGPVGFALAKTPMLLDPATSGGALSIATEQPVTVSIVIGVSSSRNPNPQLGTLTYSASFRLNAGRTDLQFLWNQMKAKIRGRVVESAPDFEPKWGESFAIQVARSEQFGIGRGPQDAVPFDFTLIKNRPGNRPSTCRYKSLSFSN